MLDDQVKRELSAKLGRDIISQYDWVTTQNGTPSFTVIITSDYSRSRVRTIDGRIRLCEERAVPNSMYIAGGTHFLDIKSAGSVVVVETEKDAEALSKEGISPVLCFGHYGSFRADYAKVLSDKTAYLIQTEKTEKTGLSKAVMFIKSYTGDPKIVKVEDLSFLYSMREIERLAEDAPDEASQLQFLDFDDKGVPKKVNLYRIYQYMLDHFHFCVNRKSGIYYYYDDDGYYHRDLVGGKPVHIRDWIRSLIHEDFYDPRIIEDVFRLLGDTASLIKDEEDFDLQPKSYINFKNGYYDLVTKEMYPHNWKHFCRTQVPFKYNPEETTECKLLDDYLDSTFYREGAKEAFLEFVGYTMTADTSMQKFVIMRGPAGYGKSTVLKVITAMLGGPRQVMQIKLSDLTDDKFAPADLYEKMANICNEMSSEGLKDVSMLNMITGQDFIRAQSKYGQPFTFLPTAKLFFSCNELPKILNNKSNNIYRRLIIFEIDKPPETKIQDLDLKIIKDGMDHFIHLCVEAGKRLYKTGEPVFSQYKDSDYRVAMYQRYNDSVEAFLQDKVERVDGERVLKTDLYNAYVMFCKQDEQIEALNRKNFYKAITESKGIKEKKSSDWYFMDIKLKDYVPESHNGWVSAPPSVVNFEKEKYVKKIRELEKDVDIKAKAIENLTARVSELEGILKFYQNGSTG